MKTFTIMFSDLNDDAKTQFLKFEGVESVSELNTDHFALATIVREEENVQKNNERQTDSIVG